MATFELKLPIPEYSSTPAVGDWASERTMSVHYPADLPVAVIDSIINQLTTWRDKRLDDDRRIYWSSNDGCWKCPHCGQEAGRVWRGETGTFYSRVSLDNDGTIYDSQSDSEDVDDVVYTCYECSREVVLPEGILP